MSRPAEAAQDARTGAPRRSAESALDVTLQNARARLLAERNAAGYWEGELSSSALSTATALIAPALAGRGPLETGDDDGRRLQAGFAWLVRHRNADGGFGDTVDSPSNLATTALAWTALGLAEARSPAGGVDCAQAARAAAAYLERHLGGLDAERLAAGLEAVYGADRTFAVPILTACALGGALGEDPEVWRHVPTLPFELAALPRGFFRRIGLPVVSYALPALIAIGQGVHARRRALGGSWNPIAFLHAAIRSATCGRTLRVLEGVQPANGGFLEATPLTSFVVMSLLACAGGADPGRSTPARRVIELGLRFLRDSMRADGSWPIDTNLATWGTTLAIEALQGDLRTDSPCEAEPDVEEDVVRNRLAAWLLGQQGREVHPYTGAAPGGWAWTDLPGGVPDADDTAGAMLALATLDRTAADGASGGAIHRREGESACVSAAASGAHWLMGLQNRDGGIPTFCRGWTKLPFDQSCPDLTAHALRAWSRWEGRLSVSDRKRIVEAKLRAARHLVATQSDSGAWYPLWFGNQSDPGQRNPTYGTSRVLRAAAAFAPEGSEHAAPDGWRRAMERGLAWSIGAQNDDGGFGGAPGLPSTIEETALALEGLVALLQAGVRCSGVRAGAIELGAVRRAAHWLVRATEQGTSFPTRPIGLYFAKLWYSERLYPIVFSVSALVRARALLAAKTA